MLTPLEVHRHNYIWCLENPFHSCGIRSNILCNQSIDCIKPTKFCDKCCRGGCVTTPSNVTSWKARVPKFSYQQYNCISYDLSHLTKGSFSLVGCEKTSSNLTLCWKLFGVTDAEFRVIPTPDIPLLCSLCLTARHHQNSATHHWKRKCFTAAITLLHNTTVLHTICNFQRQSLYRLL